MRTPYFLIIALNVFFIVSCDEIDNTKIPVNERNKITENTVIEKKESVVKSGLAPMYRFKIYEKEKAIETYVTHLTEDFLFSKKDYLNSNANVYDGNLPYIMNSMSETLLMIGQQRIHREIFFKLGTVKNSGNTQYERIPVILTFVIQNRVLTNILLETVHLPLINDEVEIVKYDGTSEIPKVKLIPRNSKEKEDIKCNTFLNISEYIDYPKYRNILTNTEQDFITKKYAELFFGIDAACDYKPLTEQQKSQIINIPSESDPRFSINADGIVTDPRFSINADGTVTDTKTKLMWKQCSEGQSGSSCEIGIAHKYTELEQTFNQAKAVNQVGFAGYNDWRVPKIEELVSIKDSYYLDHRRIETGDYSPTDANDATNATSMAFINTPFDNSFWSSTWYSKPIGRKNRVLLFFTSILNAL